MSVTLTRHAATDFDLTAVAATVAKLLGSDWTDTEGTHGTHLVTHTSGMYVAIAAGLGIMSDDSIDLGIAIGEYAGGIASVTPDDTATLIATAVEITTEIHTMRAHLLAELVANKVPMDNTTGELTSH
jgi:hypothetical protein